MDGPHIFVYGMLFGMLVGIGLVWLILELTESKE